MRMSLYTALVAMGVATSAQAQSIADQVISQLEADGFTFFEVKNSPNQVKIEAVRGSQEVEYIYDLASGALLKQETGTADAEDRNRRGIQTDSEDDDFIGDNRPSDREDDDDERDDERDDDERDDERDDDERDDDERDVERDDDEDDDDEDDDEDDEDDEDDDED